MTGDIERRLIDAGRSIDWPEADPSRHGELLDRLTSRPAARASSRGLGRIAAVVVILVLALLSTPVMRRAAADLLGLAGIRIGFGAAPAIERGLELGDPIPLDRLPEAVGFDVRMPTDAPPDAAFVDDVGTVHLVWDGGRELPAAEGSRIAMILSQSEATNEDQAAKVVSDAGAVRWVDLDGTTGIWIEGTPHVFSLLDSEGQTRTETARLAANVLLWDSGGIRHRLETTGDLREALDLVANLEPAP